MTTATPSRTPQAPRRGTATTQRAAEIKRGFKARLRRGDLLETLVYFSVAVVLALFLADGGATYFIDLKDVPTGIGIVTGLIGSDLMLVMLLLSARLPIIDRTFGHDKAIAIHRKLAPLRDAGTLIVGSGFTTHNLRWFNPGAGPDGEPPQASAEFDHWAAEALENKDIDALLNFWDKAPAAHEAHPRIEHWAPLYVSLGAALGTGLDNTTAIEGFWYGLSKRSWQFS